VVGKLADTARRQRFCLSAVRFFDERPVHDTTVADGRRRLRLQWFLEG
jgi:hypothetical protein